MEVIIIIAVAVLALYIIFRIFKAILKWVLILAILVLAVAYFSNPDSSNYWQVLREKAGNVGLTIKDNALQISDYKLFSLAKVKKDGEEKTVGIGAFGKVWYFEDAMKAFE